MDDILLQTLQATQNPTEIAAIIAEVILDRLPAKVAFVARQCIILHWFDQFIIEALLKDTSLSADTITDASSVFEQLKSLPFIETTPWGLTFQELTRDGLMQRYTDIHAELLQTAARLATPAYAAHKNNVISMPEAFFCSVVSNAQKTSVAMLEDLLEQGSKRENWYYIENLFRLQEEAERLPFVQPLTPTENIWLFHGLVHRIQGNLDAAISDYGRATDIDPVSILAYMSRGSTYVEQERYEQALADYSTVIRIEKNFALAYLSRSIIYTKQGKYKEALRENDRAMQLGLNTDTIFINKGDILNELGQFEDALVAFNTALQINQNISEAYIGIGNTFNNLEQHKEALDAYDKALLLNPDTVHAYIGKGKALNELQRYEEALAACSTAIHLNPKISDAYRAKAQALRNLRRYSEAYEVSQRANELDPVIQENTMVDEDTEDKKKVQKTSTVSKANSQKVTPLIGNLTRIFRPTHAVVQSRRKTFWKKVEKRSGLAIVAAIIFTAIILFSTHTFTSTGGHLSSLYATATAVKSTQVAATATAKINPNPRISNTYSQFSLIIDNPNGLLNNSPSAIASVEQQVKAQAVLKGRSVALAIVYGGAPSDSQIGQAQAISGKVYGVLKILGKQGFAFSRASYYNTLYALGQNLNEVEVDIFLFTQSNQTSPHLEVQFHEFTINVDPNGLLNGSQSAIASVEQQVKAQAILRGRSVGLVIVYGGAPSDSQIAQAQAIVEKVYGVLKTLGNQGFAFSRSSYYNPLYDLGTNTNIVTIDVYLFAQ